MTTCISRDLSIGVDGESSAVLDWLNTRTCQQIQNVMTRMSCRPRDWRGQSSKLDLYWVPGFVRVDAATGREVGPALGWGQRPGRVVYKVVGWSGESSGWWSSLTWAWPRWGTVFRATRNSKALTVMFRREQTEAIPVAIRSGVGLTAYRNAAPNLHCGLSLSFPRRLTASVCADVFRRWTTSVSYSFGSLVASARFAGNVATKADSSFEVGALVQLHELWAALREGSQANLSWTRDGLAFGAMFNLDQGEFRSATGVRGGIPVCINISGVFPVGQPLGGVTEQDNGTWGGWAMLTGSGEEGAAAASAALPSSQQGARGFRLFFGLELQPWMGEKHRDGAGVLCDDPLAPYFASPATSSTAAAAAATPPPPPPPTPTTQPPAAAAAAPPAAAAAAAPAPSPSPPPPSSCPAALPAAAAAAAAPESAVDILAQGQLSSDAKPIPVSAPASAPEQGAVAA